MASSGFVLGDPLVEGGGGQVAQGLRSGRLKDELAVRLLSENQGALDAVESEFPPEFGRKGNGASLAYGKNFLHAGILHCRNAGVQWIGAW